MRRRPRPRHDLAEAKEFIQAGAWSWVSSTALRRALKEGILTADFEDLFSELDERGFARSYLQAAIECGTTEVHESVRVRNVERWADGYVGKAPNGTRLFLKFEIAETARGRLVYVWSCHR